jgi:hypothetical protein
MKSIILVFAISALHFFVGIWLSVRSFGHVFSVFDTGRELTSIEKINYWVVEILFFPIVTVFERSNYESASAIEEYIPFILNSILWGIFIVLSFKLFFNRNK